MEHSPQRTKLQTFQYNKPVLYEENVSLFSNELLYTSKVLI